MSRANAADIDNTAISVEVWKHRSCQQPHPTDIQIYLFIPLLEGRLLQFIHYGDARIINQDVDLGTSPFQRFVHQLLRSLDGRQICLDSNAMICCVTICLLDSLQDPFGIFFLFGPRIIDNNCGSPIGENKMEEMSDMGDFIILFRS